MGKVLTSLVLSLILASSARAQDINDRLWAASEDKIKSALKANDPNFDKNYALQLSNFPIYATWTQKPDGQYSLYLIANSVPLWTAKWVWQPGRRFDEAYGVFVDGLSLDKIINPKQDARITNLENIYVAAKQAYATEYEKVEGKWTTYKTSHPKAIKQSWLDRGNGGQLVALHRRVNTAFSNYNASIPAPTRTTAGLIQKYVNAYEHPIEVKLPDSASSSYANDSSDWSIVAQLPFQGGDDVLKKIAESGEKAATDPTKQVHWTDINSSSVRTEESTSVGGSATLFGFINLGGHGGNYKLTDKQHKFNVRFDALSIGYLPIGPSPNWYSQFLIDNYGCGPFKSDIQFNPDDLWKENGSLSLLPSALLVAYKPSLTVTLSDEDYEKVQSMIGGSAGFSIGPFSFGGGGSSVKTTETKNDSTKEIHVAVDSDTPMVLAVLSTKLHPLNKCK